VSVTEPSGPSIVPATREHIPAILETYAHARRLQETRGAERWPEFALEEVLAEIDAERLLCVLDGQTVAGVFSIAYEDRALWDERERNDHLYLHRIAKSESAAGLSLVDVALAWARARCHQLGRSGVRMDTWASNTALIAIYERRGFAVVARKHVGRDPRLPAQYQNNDFVLLEERS